MKQVKEFIPINLEDKHMRILKGYSKEERKELEEAKDGGFSSAMTLIHGICDDIGYCRALSEKCYGAYPNDNNQLAKDIVDFYTGKAKFPVQMYRVTLPDGNYLVRDKIYGNRWMLTYSDCDGYNITHSTDSENIFTEQEIKAIDPRYMAFAVPVEADDE